MKKSIITAAVLFSCMASPAYAVNKCTINGKTVYQDKACEGAEKIDTQANGPLRERMTMDEIAQDERRPVRRKVDHQAVTRGMANGNPVVGMTSQQLMIAMGNPQRSNTGDYGGRQADQLIYEREGTTYYVYVRDGVVSSVQSSNGYKRSSARSQKRCPTSLEIRNMETSANSATISNMQRRELYREIRQAKACE